MVLLFLSINMLYNVQLIQCLFWLAVLRALFFNGVRESQPTNKKLSKFLACGRRKLFLISEIMFVFHYFASYSKLYKNNGLACSIKLWTHLGSWDANKKYLAFLSAVIGLTISCIRNALANTARSAENYIIHLTIALTPFIKIFTLRRED